MKCALGEIPRSFSGDNIGSIPGLDDNAFESLTQSMLSTDPLLASFGHKNPSFQTWNIFQMFKHMKVHRHDHLLPFFAGDK